MSINRDQQKICTACGTQFPSGPDYELCPICADDRQYIPEKGQTWTTHKKLLISTSIRILKLGKNVYELTTIPRFAIGQRAILVITARGNILWDCIPLLNESTIEFIKSKGGLGAISFSHPHYYSNMNDWAEMFNCPVYIHRSDVKWIFNKGKHIVLWEGQSKALWNGITIINIGGHFPGSSILHLPGWPKGGAIFCGDTLYLGPDMKHVSVMYSYPNCIPLPRHEVFRIKSRLEAIPFDALYGFWSYQNIKINAKKIVADSLSRYTE